MSALESGIQRGSSWSALSRVICSGDPPARRRIQMCRRPSAMATKATILPSGDIAGLPAMPTASVSRSKCTSGAPCRAETATASSAPGASSRSSRASPMSRSLRLTSFCRHRCRSLRTAGGVRVAGASSPARAQHPDDGVGDRVADERADAGEHLVEHAAERPDVGALVHRLAARLLGAHVGRRAEHRARPRRRRSVIVGDRGCSESDPMVPRPRPKSSTFTHTVRADLDVGGLQVAVDDALFVRGVERRRRSGARCRWPRAWRAPGFACGVQHVLERVAFDQLQHERARRAGSSMP